MVTPTSTGGPEIVHQLHYVATILSKNIHTAFLNSLSQNRKRYAVQDYAVNNTIIDRLTNPLLHTTLQRCYGRVGSSSLH